jgi:hypothetical protein
MVGHRTNGSKVLQMRRLHQAMSIGCPPVRHRFRHHWKDSLFAVAKHNRKSLRIELLVDSFASTGKKEGRAERNDIEQ